MGGEKRELLANLRPQRTLDGGLQLGLLRPGESATGLEKLALRRENDLYNFDDKPFLEHLGRCGMSATGQDAAS